MPASKSKNATPNKPVKAEPEVDVLRVIAAAHPRAKVQVVVTSKKGEHKTVTRTPTKDDFIRVWVSGDGKTACAVAVDGQKFSVAI